MGSDVKEGGVASDVVVTKKAFNLSCSWVQKLSGGADFDVEEETQGLPNDDAADVRPTRAKLVPTKTSSSYQGIRKASNNYEEEVVQAQDEDEEDDSRASVFKKRPNAFVRPTLIVSETTGSKKKKRKGP